MRTRQRPRLLSALLVTALSLAACSGDNSPLSTDEAAETTSDDTVVIRTASSDDTSCPEHRSTALYPHLANGLPRPLTLSATQNGWNCEDWSGVSTPGRAFNRKVLEPGEGYRFRLELRHLYSGDFTLHASSFGYEGLDQVPIEMETRVGVRYSSAEEQKIVPMSGVPEQWMGQRWQCRFVPLTTAPSSWRDTPVEEVREAFNVDPWTLAAMFIVYKGRIGLLYAAGADVEESPGVCPSR